MTRSTGLSAIALVLAGYAIYTALYVPAMLVGPPMPLLVAAFIAQVVCALVAAAGLWSEAAWTAVVVGFLAASIVATQLIEVLLGILPYLRAVVVAVLAIVGALLLVSALQRSARAV